MNPAADTPLPPSPAHLPRPQEPAAGARASDERPLPLLSLAQWTVLLNRLAADARHQRSGVAVWTLAIDAACPLDGQAQPGDDATQAGVDTMIAPLSQRLSSRLRSRDRVVRLGHGLFGVVTVGVDARLAAPIGERLVTALRAPCRVGDQLLTARLRSAAAVYPDDGADAAALLEHMATQLGAGTAPH